VTKIKIRDRVRVDGRGEIFRVVHVDHKRGSVDLACIERVDFLLHVPLRLVHPVKDGARE
jgi:hypothetical protein